SDSLVPATTCGPPCAARRSLTRASQALPSGSEPMSTETSRHPPEIPPHPDATGGPVWLYAAAGLCASLVGLGLARFAYTPLIPALIAGNWFNPTDAVYLGAANLAGYLAGALVARWIGARAGAVNTLRVMMVLASACFFACAAPQPFTTFFVWRFL